MELCAGVTTTDTADTGRTVTSALTVVPSTAAEIATVPTATAVTVPSDPIDAMVAFALVHVTGRFVKICPVTDSRTTAVNLNLSPTAIDAALGDTPNVISRNRI